MFDRDLTTVFLLSSKYVSDILYTNNMLSIYNQSSFFYSVCLTSVISVKWIFTYLLFLTKYSVEYEKFLAVQSISLNILYQLLQIAYNRCMCIYVSRWIIKYLI